MMKLLLFSDLHTEAAAAARIVKLAEDVEVVIGAGDFANSRGGLFSCIEILRQIKKPTVLVPGNNESFDELLSRHPQASPVTIVNIYHQAGANRLGPERIHICER